MNIPKTCKILFCAFFLCFLSGSSLFAVQPDTLKIKEVNVAPVFDGKADDVVWKNANWISLDQVWIPWKGTIEKNDFSGRYKVLWSGKANLLYIVAEITDDVFRDGYVYSQTDPTYSDYDIFEIFLDPDHSGGLHVFDGNCDDPKNKNCWGVNGQGAFTYHINVNAPANHSVTHSKTAEDISGKDWDHKIIQNYASHLPDFTFRKDNNVYTYEFSLKVYKDTYNPQKPSEKDRDTLYPGKIMGISAAYCDDDHKTGTAKRDNFIGSTPGDDKALDENGNFNQAWMNASYLGTAKLIGISSSR